MVLDSLQAHGAGRSVLLDRNNRIIAGNKTVAAALEAGLLDVQYVDTDGKRIIAVRRTDLDLKKDPAAQALAVADNRTAEVGLDWDAEVLRALDEQIDLSALFDEDEITRLIGVDKSAESDAPEPRIEKAEELLAKWKVERGQLWQIQSASVKRISHRILCGDAQEWSEVEHLMLGAKAAMCFTDPPWNVAIGGDGNPRHRQRPGLQNDNMAGVDFAEFINKFSGNIARVNSGDVYCILGASEWPVLDSQLRKNGFHWSATIIWVKDLFVLGRSKYHRRYEPLWYGWHANGKSSFAGDRKQDDVWEIPRPRRSEEHPTMKPVDLPRRAIRNSSRVASIVLDPFAGAGSTMAAAELEGRACFAMDVDAKYVAVTLERMQEMGLKPKLARPGVSSSGHGGSELS